MPTEPSIYDAGLMHAQAKIVTIVRCLTEGIGGVLWQHTGNVPWRLAIMLMKIVAILGLVALIGGNATPGMARPPFAKAAVKITIDRLIQGEMAARNIPGLQLAIVRHQRIVFTGAYGNASLENTKPVTDRTVFPINSISKAFAGVAAMQLVEAGKLDLDAPAATYLDGLPQPWQGITIRQLLTHTSGLPEIIDDNVRLIDGTDPEAAWTKVRSLPLRSTPGWRFAYTQTNYLVVGMIVEKISGKSFADFVRDGQFTKAGMRRTGFGDAAKAMAPDASVYTYLRLLTEGTMTVGVQKSTAPLVRHEAWPEYLRPAGGMQSTATDLARWAIALQARKLLDRRRLEQLWKPQISADGKYGGFSSTINGYALGWPSVRRVDHPAITPVGGERAAMFVYPNDDLTVIVLTNLMGASPQTFIDRIAALYF